MFIQIGSGILFFLCQLKKHVGGVVVDFACLVSTVYTAPFTFLLASIFVSIFLGYLANFVFSSVVLMCHSRQSIKNFDGPPSRWLHGHMDRVRK